MNKMRRINLTSETGDVNTALSLVEKESTKEGGRFYLANKNNSFLSLNYKPVPKTARWTLSNGDTLTLGENDYNVEIVEERSL